MSIPSRVALVGFSSFERTALGSYFRLAARRQPAYVQVDGIADAQFLIVDADHAGFADQVVAAGRVGDSVFIGGRAPDGASAWMMRPIDPLNVLRELDVLVSLRAAAAASPPSAAKAASVAPALPPLPALPAFTEPRPLAAPMSPKPAAVEVKLPPPRPPPAAAPLPRPAPPAERIDVLLVDDSEIALRFLEKLATEYGLTPHLAGSARKAMELLARHAFRIVFLDVDLGERSEIDGLGLCQRIKREQIHLGDAPPQVVLVSAHATPLDRVRGDLAGCDGYLGKPLQLEEFRTVLRRSGVSLPAVATR